MLSLLIKPLLGVVTDSVKGYVETKKAKAELAVTEIKAAKAIKEQQIAGKISWEASAVDLILICLLVPAVAVFIPGWTPHIKAGFEALHSLPDYYKHLLYIACSASFGIKGAKGAMGLITKKK